MAGAECAGASGTPGEGGLWTPTVCEQIVERLPDPLVVVDRRYVVRAANAAYLRLRGRTLPQTVGHSVAAIAGREAFEQTIRPEIDRALAGEASTRAAWIDFPAGHRYIELCHYPLHVAGRVELVAVLLRDLTERARAEEERERLLTNLRQANERLLVAGGHEVRLAEESGRRAAEAEAALRLRDEFLDVAAHELKTPLTSLRGQVQLTIRRSEQGRLQGPEQLRRALRAIDRQVDRLASLVAQLRVLRFCPLTI